MAVASKNEIPVQVPKQACPKGVDPAFGIQLLKRTLVLDNLGFGKNKKTAKVHPLADVVAEIEKFKAPPRTVK